MLTVQNISKSYGVQPLLIDVSFSVNAGDRIGLVGSNGSGKTTLLRLITGQEKPDSGVVRFLPPTLRCGYLPQGAEFNPDDTITGFIARCEGNLPELSARLEILAGALADQPDLPGLQAEYDATLAAIKDAAGIAGRGQAVLTSLGLGLLSPDLPTAVLSGGQKTRLALAGVLLGNPSLLLLDEPTNHLDLDMLIWLEDWLKHFRGAALVVSHDRTFLDRVATGIIEIDDFTHRARSFAGNYTAFLEQKMAGHQKHWEAYQDQQEEITRLRAAASAVRSLAKFHKGGKADSGDKFAAGFFANRGKGTVQKAKNIERRIESLLTTEHIDKPQRNWEMKMDFPDTPPSGRDVVVLEEVSIGFGEKNLLQNLNFTLHFGSRTALIGPNGCGKTTLLRTITGALEPLSGRVRLGSGVKLGYMTQEQEGLQPDLNALQTLHAVTGQGVTETRSFLSLYLFKGDDVFTPAGLLSYGERARLMLALLVAQGCNLLLLDEPINHLDIPARTRFEQALSGFQGSILAVVHDRYFLRGFARELWQVRAQTIQRVDLSFGEFPNLVEEIEKAADIQDGAE